MADVTALTAKTQIASTAETAFGLRLAGVLAKEAPRQNVFISPTGIFLALGMLEAGAAGNTRAAVRGALAIPADVGDSALHESVAALNSLLQQRSNIELSIANALWADRRFPLAPDFVALCQRYYQAQAESLDFRGPGAAAAINDWVKKNTRGKISEIVDPRIVAAASAILTNAIYFKGKWQYPFDPKLTQKGDFHLTDQTVRQVSFMHRDELRNTYRSGDGFEGAVLPYGAAGQADLVLCVLLPKPGSDPAELLAKTDVRGLLDRSDNSQLDLRLPKFTLDYAASLKKPLEAMGMGIAFQYPGADFSPLGSREFYVGDVLHKTRLEVDEEGTVAAAATAVVGIRAAFAPPPRKVLTVDRPFALLLCDRPTGAVLFAGAIYQP